MKYICRCKTLPGFLLHLIVKIKLLTLIINLTVRKTNNNNKARKDVKHVKKSFVNTTNTATE